MKNSMPHFLMMFILLANVGVSYAGLAFDPPKFVLEVLPDTKSIPVRFKVTNPSAKPCIIKTVKTSCSCTHIDLTSKTLSPNESVDVATTLTLKNDGKDYRTDLAFVTDDLTTPTYLYSLTLNMREVSSLKTKPAILNFTDLKPGEKKTDKIEVYYFGGNPARIPTLDSLKAINNIEGLELKQTASAENYFAYDLTYTAPQRKTMGKATIQFLSEKAQVSVNLPVSIDNSGSVVMEPRAIAWGFLSSNTSYPIQKTITLKAVDKTCNLKDIQMEYDREAFAITSGNTSTDNEMQYVIALRKPPVQEGKYSSAVKFKLPATGEEYSVENSGYVMR